MFRYLNNLTSEEKNTRSLYYTKITFWATAMTYDIFLKQKIAVQLNPGRFFVKNLVQDHPSIFGEIPHCKAASIWKIQPLVPSCWDPVAWRLRCASSSLQCFGARCWRHGGKGRDGGMNVSQEFKGRWWVMFFIFTPDPWGNDPIWWGIFFQMGWNHQLERDSYANGDMGILRADGLEKCGEKTSWGW